MEVSSAEAVAGGMKGKGLRLLHHAFDALWSLGDKSTPGSEFTPSRVFPMGDASAAAAAPAAPAAPAAQPEKKGEEEQQDKEGNGEEEVERASAGIAALGLSPSATTAAAPAPPPSAAPSPPNSSSGSSAPPSSSSTSSSFFPADLDLSSTAGQDAIAEFCLLSACASVPPSSLPMLTSDFQKEMARARPAAGCPALDLKKTSHKQLSKLLKKFEKLGVLGTKVLRKQDMVSSVDAGHVLVVEFLAKNGGGRGGSGGSGSGNGGGGGGGGANDPATAAGEEAAGGGGANPSSSSAVPPLSIEPAFRVSPSLRPVFAAPGAPPAPADGFYSEAEVKRALAAYLAAEKLLLLVVVSSSSDATTNPPPCSSASASTVDRLLLAALFNKGSDRELAEGEGKALPVSELEERLLARLTKYTRVRRHVAAAGSSPPSFEERVFRGPLKKISIAVEDRQGGRKHVTRVSGVERYALSPEGLASTLQKKFKTSASVSRVSADEEEVALQGDAARQLVLFLASEYGIGGAHIDVKTKGGGR